MEAIVYVWLQTELDSTQSYYHYKSYCVTLVFPFIIGEINSHSSEMQDIERNIRSMQNDMTKLNTLITKESGLREALQQGTVLMESDFIQALKVTELLSKNIIYMLSLKLTHCLPSGFTVSWPSHQSVFCQSCQDKTLRVCAWNCSLFAVGNIKRDMTKGVKNARDILTSVLWGSARPSFDWFRLLLSEKKNFRLVCFKKVFICITLGWNSFVSSR